MGKKEAADPRPAGPPVESRVRKRLIFPVAVLALLATVLVAPLLGARPAAAAVSTSVGTHFWVAFPTNIGAGSTLMIFISAETTTTGSAVAGGVSYPFSVSAGSTTSVTVPSALRVSEADGVGSNGIEITANAPVSVYGLNTQGGTSGGFLALPVPALGTDYRVLAAPAASAPQLTALATVANTTVTITPKTTVAGHTAGVAYTRTLNAGQTYQLQAPSGPDILSGTTVTSDKPVVVYSGAACGNIPTENIGACDHLVQQLIPTDAWGKNFLAMPFATRLNGDYYRVLAHQAGTDVSVNGTQVATLNAGEVYQSQIATPTVEISASKPVLAAQFANGTEYDNTTGDPLMMLIPPAGQYLNRYTIAAPSVSGFAAYATLIVRTADVGQVSMDGNALAANLFTAIGTTGYSGATMPVSSAAHRFAAPNGFGLQIYEWGSSDGFGFPGGMAVAPIANAGPPPTPAALTSSGAGTQSATATVPSGGSIALLDGSSLSPSVTVFGEGTYTVDPATGVITFTPVNSYSGTVTPVTYRVTDMYNQSGDNTYTPTLAAVAPGVPGTPTVVAGDGQATVTVTAGSGGAPDSYSVRVVGDAAKSCTVTAPATSCTVTGLTNGTAYTFESRATNTVGTSAWSAASASATPVVAIPGTPGTPVAVTGDERAVVTITAPGNGGAVASYSVRVLGDATKSCTVTAPATSCTVTGLTNGTPYTFESRATNTTGSSAWSAVSNSVTPVRVLPGTPGTPEAVARTESVTLTWTAPQPGNAVTGYVVTPYRNGVAEQPRTFVSTATSQILGNLTGGAAYTFTVAAVNSAGTGPASAASTAVTPPAFVPPPAAISTAPTATAGTSSITVSWPAATGQVSGYTAYASPGEGSCTTTSAADTSCVIGAVAGTSYTVTVVARGPGGPAAASPASAAVVPTAPVPPATAPADVPMTLTTDKGQVSLAVPSQQLTIIGTGFAPYSTAKVTLYSTPIDLGTVITDADGNFSLAVTMPAEVGAGQHTFLASGVDPDGSARRMALPITVPPTSPGSTGSDTSTQQTDLPVPAGGAITLLDGSGNPASTVTVSGQGTYALDAATGTITFVPVTGFTGKATPVSYRITDAVGSVVTGTYTAVVTKGGTEVPGPGPSTGAVQVTVAKLLVTRGRPAAATVPVVISFPAATRARNTLTLWSTVSGKRVVLGTGRSVMTTASRRAAVTVTLNPLGRALAARPGGYPVAAAVTSVPAEGRTLRASSRTRLVLNQFTAARSVYFASGSSTVSAAQRRYLAGLRGSLAGVRSITCTGHTDDRGNQGSGLRLGRSRAAAVCRALVGNLRIRTYVVTRGEANPTGSNKTPAGMARNRRADITIRY